MMKKIIDENLSDKLNLSWILMLIINGGGIHLPMIFKYLGVFENEMSPVCN